MRLFGNLLAKLTAGVPLTTLERARLDGSVLDAGSVSAVAETVTWGANLAPDGTFTRHNITATSGIASAIAVPTGLVPGNRHLFVITNGSGGAMGAMTWAAGYLMPALVLPPNGETITVEFEAISATQLRQVGAATAAAGAGVIGVVTPAWGAAIVIARTLGNVFNVVAADNTAYTYGAPTVSVPGDRITIRFQNASGVTSGAGAFNAVYALRGPAIPALANGVGYEITFVCIAAAGAGSWEEESRASQLATTTAVLIGRQSALGGPYEEIPTQLPTFVAGSPFVAFQLAPAQALTNAQILALPTTPVAIAAPAVPGAGFFILPIAAWVRVNATAGIYTNIDAGALIAVRYSTGVWSLREVSESDGEVSDLIGTASSNAAIMGLGSSVATLANIENRALQIMAGNGAAGDFAGGNAANTGSVRILWGLLPV